MERPSQRTGRTNGPRHIALVGCGFTGTSAFFQLVDSYPVDRITIFEASGDFGPGYPYRTDECADYLINNTTDSMCLAPGNRRAFLDWLEARAGRAADLDPAVLAPGGNLPRRLFGAFLKDVVAATRTTAAVKGIKVALLPEEVTSLAETADGRVSIGWRGGETSADAVLLTTGRCPDVDVYPHPPAGSAARYVANHVMSPALDDLPDDATVHVLGASLSAYDVINRLFSPDSGCRFVPGQDGRLGFEAGPNRRRVVLCSRSGRLKAMQSRSPARTARRHFTLEALTGHSPPDELRLSEVAGIIRKEAESRSVEIDWDALRDPYGSCTTRSQLDDRAVALLSAAISAASSEAGRNFLVDLFSDAQIDLWDAFATGALRASDERTYRERLETAALCYAAPCPVPTGEKLLALLRAGRLSVIKGVREVRLAEDGHSYRIAHDFGQESASVLVNTTGAVDRDVTSDRQPELVRALRQRGLLNRYERDGQPMKGAAVHMESFRAKGARNIYVANMLLWGPGFFTSSAFMMATVVERLLASLFCEE